MNNMATISGFNPGTQWQNIINRLSTSTFDLTNMKNTPELMLFGTFDPQKFGVCYLRTLIYYVYNNLSNEAKDILKNTKNRLLGNPYVTKIEGEYIDLDYIQSASETAFIKPELDQVSTIIEIGAGYGRTCHTIINNCSHLINYYIIDLPFSTKLSSAYLKMVLSDEDFNKLIFINTDEINSFLTSFKESPVLFINIDSMAEMSADVVKNYFSMIDQFGHYFFSKNTVGKYAPYDMGEKNINQKEYRDAIESGLIPQVINVFDLQEIKSCIQQYKKTYTPSKFWHLKRESPSDCYLHYYLALFEKHF